MNVTVTNGSLGTAIVYSLMIPLDCIALVILIHLIMEYELRRVGKRFSLKIFWSPMNRLLILALYV
ncbi:hypothetical protein BCR33DRAFT_20512 [Rhizoclosmatium globosum]|uniref:Uncharacterized protein n=1 Tax=Rhizoclosmatium globosum TaxID=329046 RepID=A0A1Y2CQ79_9FUNG|nr:hypothetical protein BCR33DRAFT_20512 [Rhizoclosmatium globosum]|eukprot:ORY49180.1 hypothetical protein BCR33DRAFT_20512 [Rhizoclosmatium globosum]